MVQLLAAHPCPAAIKGKGRELAEREEHAADKHTCACMHTQPPRVECADGEWRWRVKTLMHPFVTAKTGVRLSGDASGGYLVSTRKLKLPRLL